jgi:hypothetical protein
MAKEPQPVDPDKIELRPDGWERFRMAVHAAAKNGPQHRKPADKPNPSVVVKDTGKP